MPLLPPLSKSAHFPRNSKDISLPLATPKEQVKVNTKEWENASTGKGTPLSEKSNQSALDQSLADALVQMNQQLVGVMKQNAETTTVI